MAPSLLVKRARHTHMSRPNCPGSNPRGRSPFLQNWLLPRPPGLPQVLTSTSWQRQSHQRPASTGGPHVKRHSIPSLSWCLPSGIQWVPRFITTKFAHYITTQSIKIRKSSDNHIITCAKSPSLKLDDGILKSKKTDDSNTDGILKGKKTDDSKGIFKFFYPIWKLKSGVNNTGCKSYSMPWMVVWL